LLRASFEWPDGYSVGLIAREDKGAIEMTLQSRRSRRSDGGTDRAFAMDVERVTLDSVVGADRQERAIISAPTALEVVQRDRSRDLS
jgi:hypothetical protein